MRDIKKIADEADVIVDGYAFTVCDEGYQVLNLHCPDRVSGLSRSFLLIFIV